MGEGEGAGGGYVGIKTLKNFKFHKNIYICIMHHASHVRKILIFVEKCGSYNDLKTTIRVENIAKPETKP